MQIVAQWLVAVTTEHQKMPSRNNCSSTSSNYSHGWQPAQEICKHHEPFNGS